MVLSEVSQEIEFSHYRRVLKNIAVVDQIEAAYKSFRPVTYDVSKTLAAINSFEAAAIQNAEATKNKVDIELADLQKTLKNIEDARSFEDLTVVRIQ